MSALATVVVVSWNAGDLLRLALDGLSRQDVAAGSFDTVVVDNASQDGTADMVERDYPWVTLIRNSTNLGFAGGNNSALRDVTTPYAVLLNNDAVPEPDWLRRLLTAFEDPTVGVVTGKVLFMPRFARIHAVTPGFSPGAHDPRQLGVRVHGVGVDGKDVTSSVLWERSTWGPEHGFTWTRPEGDWLVPVPAQGPATVTMTCAAETTKDLVLAWQGGSATLAIGTDIAAHTFTIDAPRVDVINNVGGVVLDNGHGADRGYQHVDDGTFDLATEVMTGCGNGMAVRAAAGHAVGWFDEDFFLYYEDTDLSWRLRNRGWAVRYEPTAVLRHLHAASSGEVSDVFRFHVDRNRLLMLTKLAPAALARREVVHYPITTLSMTLRAIIGFVFRRPGRPSLRRLALRWRVVRSYARLLPRMLRRRRTERREATVPRREIMALVTSVKAWHEGAA